MTDAIINELAPYMDALAAAETDERFIDEFLVLLEFLVGKVSDPWVVIASFLHGVVCGRGIQDEALFTFISGFIAHARRTYGDDLFEDAAIFGIARLARKVLQATDEETRLLVDDIMGCSRCAQA